MLSLGHRRVSEGRERLVPWSPIAKVVLGLSAHVLQDSADSLLTIDNLKDVRINLVILTSLVLQNALVILLHLAVRITINQCDLVDFPKVELRNVHPAKDGVDKQLLLGEFRSECPCNTASSRRPDNH